MIIIASVLSLCTQGWSWISLERIEDRMKDEKVEIKFVTLECGHTVTPEIGMGVCSKCGKACCSKCLQVIDGELLCPECFKKFVSGNDGSSRQ